MKKLTTILCLLFTVSAFAQTTITLPKASPHALVKQTIGLTDITVDYHSPAVKNRTVWGGLVPYDKIWRAGANENTKISFTDDVSIGGKPLAAGTYGLHMIPTKDKWTIIFSKNHTSWGSYFYKKEEDALRVEVTAKAHPHTEWLTYTFFDKSENSVTLSLLWEKLEIPVKIDVDVNAIVFANMKNELRNIPGFTWDGFYAAADFCYKNNMETEQALKWVETANKYSQNNFNVLKLKANLLERSGDKEEADKVMKEAVGFATENELNTYGYDLVNANKIDEAVEIFKLNVKRNPKSWNAHDSYAEALAKKGKKKEAIKEYKTALKNTPPEAQVKRISKTIKELQG
jgi:tetratricopeptide (TPR) repeat protein